MHIVLKRIHFKTRLLLKYKDQYYVILLQVFGLVAQICSTKEHGSGHLQRKILLSLIGILENLITSFMGLKGNIASLWIKPATNIKWMTVYVLINITTYVRHCKVNIRYQSTVRIEDMCNWCICKTCNFFFCSYLWIRLI